MDIAVAVIGFIFFVCNALLSLLFWAIIISAILSWLFVFEIINPRNRLVYSILSFLDAVTRPLMEPFRRIIPPLGGVDISPLVVLLLLQFVQMLFNNMAAPVLLGF